LNYDTKTFLGGGGQKKELSDTFAVVLCPL